MTQDEIQAVARALAGPRADDMTRAGYPVWKIYQLGAQAAIAALDAVRGDRVAQVVEWLRNGAMAPNNRLTKRIGGNIAAAIERGEPFNG